MKRSLENETITSKAESEWFYGSGPKKAKETDEAANNENSPVGNTSPPQKCSPKIPAYVKAKRDTLLAMSMGNFDTFPKQRLAVEKLIESRKLYRNSRIFSYETKDGTGGERRYLVTTLDRFWTWYKDQKKRHLYELIYEDSPCRLYFDLEFSKVSNPDVDEMVAYNHFCSTLIKVMKSQFDLSLTQKEMLVLDSSTPQKFSAHVICHLKDGLLFPSSTSIRALTDVLAKEMLHEPPVEILNTDGTQPTTLFDSAVYTKNRNFRLFLSSKMGKEVVLRRASYCQFRDGQKMSDQQIFFDSLCVPADFEKFDVVPMPTANGCSTSFSRDPSVGGNDSAQSSSGQGTSPFPQLDEFLLTVLRKWSPSVYIKQWKLIEKDGKVQSIVFYPANCRYCFNIGRQHKSNGTYWTVNLARGEFYQKCFDPDCRGSSSNMFPLPAFLRESVESAVTNENLDGSFSNEDVSSLFERSQHEMHGFFTRWDQVFEA